MKIERNLLLDYQAACKMLPNVKPRTVTNILKKANAASPYPNNHN